MAEISKEDMGARLGNIDQIRDLLFGHKTEEYEQLFEKHTERLDKLESELSQFKAEMGGPRNCFNKYQNMTVTS